MTYWLLNVPFLVIAGLVAVAALLTRRAPRWRAVGLTGVVLLVLTAVFDNVLVATGIVGYDASRISGVLVGVAPLEDFAYAIAAVVLLPSLWALTGGGLDMRLSAATRPARGAR
ncbi:MAG TPA: lycopene cyclase domain-containing protein [Pseudolysinimonas sp.]